MGLFQRVGKSGHRAVDVGQLGLAVSDARQRRREAVHHAAQGRIGGKRAQERLRGDELLHRLAHVPFGEEQQAVALEERSAVGAAHRREHHLVFGQLGGQRVGRAVGPFGRRSVDHHQDEVVALGEQLVETCLLFAPREVGRRQRHAVGVHGEMSHRVQAGGDGQQNAGRDDGARVTA